MVRLVETKGQSGFERLDFMVDEPTAHIWEAAAVDMPGVVAEVIPVTHDNKEALKREWEQVHYTGSPLNANPLDQVEGLTPVRIRIAEKDKTQAKRAYDMLSANVKRRLLEDLRGNKDR